MSTQNENQTNFTNEQELSDSFEQIIKGGIDSFSVPSYLVRPLIQALDANDVGYMAGSDDTTALGQWARTGQTTNLTNDEKTPLTFTISERPSPEEDVPYISFKQAQIDRRNDVETLLSSTTTAVKTRKGLTQAFNDISSGKTQSFRVDLITLGQKILNSTDDDDTIIGDYCTAAWGAIEKESNKQPSTDNMQHKESIIGRSLITIRTTVNNGGNGDSPASKPH